MLLLIAAAISLVVWLYARDEPVPYEALVIFAIVLFNGILGYVQEAQAERSVVALRAMAAAEASVLRDGQPVGIIIAAGTFLVLDASLPGGLISGSGDMQYGRTMAFTTLFLFQMFNVFNARSDTHSVVYQLFHNPWLFGAVALSLLLQVAVIYVPFLQRAFDTVPLRASDWLTCVLVASSVLWLRELSKAVGAASPVSAQL
jgi:magnesium-transporting ATPase (P-type)